LARLKDGIVAGQAERRMAARLASHYAALPIATDPGESLRSVASPEADTSSPALPIVSDDDDDTDLADATADDGGADSDDFYADAFEVLT